MSDLADVTQEQLEEAMQRACDEQVALLEKVKKEEEAKKVADLIVERYGDTLGRLANE